MPVMPPGILGRFAYRRNGFADKGVFARIMKRNKKYVKREAYIESPAFKKGFGELSLFSKELW